MARSLNAHESVEKYLATKKVDYDMKRKPQAIPNHDWAWIIVSIVILVSIVFCVLVEYIKIKRKNAHMKQKKYKVDIEAEEAAKKETEGEKLDEAIDDDFKKVSDD